MQLKDILFLATLLTTNMNLLSSDTDNIEHKVRTLPESIYYPVMAFWDLGGNIKIEAGSNSQHRINMSVIVEESEIPDLSRLLNEADFTYSFKENNPHRRSSETREVTFIAALTPDKN